MSYQPQKPSITSEPGTRFYFEICGKYPERLIRLEEWKKLAQAAKAYLNSTEYHVLSLAFGWGGAKPMRQVDIGKSELLGREVSSARVGKIFQTALGKLRAADEFVATVCQYYGGFDELIALLDAKDTIIERQKKKIFELEEQIVRLNCLLTEQANRLKQLSDQPPLLPESLQNCAHWPLSRLNLSIAAYNRLERDDVKSVGDLAERYLKATLQEVRRFGKQAYRQVETELLKLGVPWVDHIWSAYSAPGVLREKSARSE